MAFAANHVRSSYLGTGYCQKHTVVYRGAVQSPFIRPLLQSWNTPTM